MNGRRYLNQIFIETSTDLDTLPSSSTGKLSSQRVEASVVNCHLRGLEQFFASSDVLMFSRHFMCIANDNFTAIPFPEYTTVCQPHPQLLSFLFALSSLGMWAWLREVLQNKTLSEGTGSSWFFLMIL